MTQHDKLDEPINGSDVAGFNSSFEVLVA